MAPKVTCNPAKLTSIVSYFHKSRTAHSIKDLEKHLPSVASINGMQVKDYLQALADENRIQVEKIGAGNWYWSFASQEIKIRRRVLEGARAAYEKQSSTINELRAKIAEAATEPEDEHDDDADEMLDGAPGGRRANLAAERAQLEADLALLSKELAACSKHDAVDMECKQVELKTLVAEAEACTDDIYAIEGWFVKMGAVEALAGLRAEVYGEELDEESGMLREIF